MRSTVFALIALVASSLSLGGCAGSSAQDSEEEPAAAEGALTLTDDAEIILAGGGYFKVERLERNGKWVFNLRSRQNNKTVLSSEQYERKDSAIKGLQSVLRNIALDSRISEDDDRIAFSIKAKNGETVAVSQKYSSISNRTRALKAIRAMVGRLPPAEEDAERHETDATLDVEEPMAELVAARSDRGGFRIRLIDADKKLLLRTPGSKTYQQGRELDDAFFGIQLAAETDVTNNDGLPPAIEVKKGEAGYFFHILGENGAILGVSPKTDYSPRTEAVEAARHVAKVIAEMPKG